MWSLLIPDILKKYEISKREKLELKVFLTRSATRKQMINHFYENINKLTLLTKCLQIVL